MRYGQVLIRSAVIVLSAIVLVFATGLLARGMGPSEPVLRAVETDERVLPVEARRVRYQDSYRTREAYAGKAVARRASDLGFETAGQLESFLVDEGDEIQKGQPLARLDRRQLEARREELAAQLELARVTARRRANPLKRNNVSRQSYDEARLQAAATKAALKAVEVQIDLAELKAPYDAVVVERLADEGTVTRPGQPILRIIERDAWEARIGLPPEIAGRLRPGETLKLTVSGTDYTGILRHVLPQVQQTTRTALALFDIEGPTVGLRSGALARVWIETEVRERGFWLPVTALTEGRRGLWTAYVIDTDEKDGAAAGGVTGSAERRQLQVIHTGTDRAYVRGAVEEGEFVVTAGAHRIVPGQLVRRAEEMSASGR